jgi:hypothetical protein
VRRSTRIGSATSFGSRMTRNFLRFDRWLSSGTGVPQLLHRRVRALFQSVLFFRVASCSFQQCCLVADTNI